MVDVLNINRIAPARRNINNLFEQVARGGAGLSNQAALALLEEVNPILSRMIDVPGVSVGRSYSAEMQKNQDIANEALRTVAERENVIRNQMIETANRYAYKAPSWSQGPTFNNRLIPIPEGMGIEEWRQIQDMVNTLSAETLAQLNKDYALKTVLEQKAKEQGTGIEDLVTQYVKELVATDLPNYRNLLGRSLEGINATASNAVEQIRAMAAKGGAVGSTGTYNAISRTLLDAASKATQAVTDSEIAARKNEIQTRIAIASAAAGTSNEAMRLGHEAANIIASIYGSGQPFRDLGTLSRR